MCVTRVVGVVVFICISVFILGRGRFIVRFVVCVLVGVRIWVFIGGFI